MIDEIISLLEGGDVQSALVRLNEIKSNTQGIAKLGSYNSVVITHPQHTSEDLFDAVRYITKAYVGGDSSAKNIRVTNILMGSPCVKLFPDWFLSYAGHVDTESFILLLYHCMVEFDLNEAIIDSMPDKVNAENILKREMALFEGRIKHINQEPVGEIK